MTDHPRIAPPANRAAWIAKRHGPLQVSDAPYSPPGDGQIAIAVRAVAVNPLDWIIQVAGGLAYRWLDYPTVLGSDVAGEVVEVGANVTRFAVGDRVVAHAVGTDKDSNRAAEGGFQRYCVVSERLASPIPETLTFARAAVLPMAVSTASSALFQDDQLGLDHPSLDPRATGRTVLVWGGSTSVGTHAIQLAVAAGYEVLTTCSPHNADYARSLGAARAFDYNSPTVVDDIVTALADRTLAGAIAIGPTAANSCVRIVGRSTGRRAIAIATPPVSFARLGPEGRARFATVRFVARLVTSNIALQVRARTHGVTAKYIWGTSLKNTEVSQVVYRDFLPAALASGRYAALPEPQVVGTGLDDLQHALDVQRRGVSAAKVVVTLDSTD